MLHRQRRRNKITSFLFIPQRLETYQPCPASFTGLLGYQSAQGPSEIKELLCAVELVLGLLLVVDVEDALAAPPPLPRNISTKW